MALHTRMQSPSSGITVLLSATGMQKQSCSRSGVGIAVGCLVKVGAADVGADVVGCAEGEADDGTGVGLPGVIVGCAEGEADDGAGVGAGVGAVGAFEGSDDGTKEGAYVGSLDG